jgi:hypothetical protein
MSVIHEVPGGALKKKRKEFSGSTPDAMLLLQTALSRILQKRPTHPEQNKKVNAG